MTLLEEITDSLFKLRAVHTEQMRGLLNHIEAWQMLEANLKKNSQTVEEKTAKKVKTYKKKSKKVNVQNEGET